MFDRGILLFKEGKVNEGIQILERVCKCDPSNQNAHGHLAWALFSQKRWNEARDIYEKIIRAKPDNPEPGFRLLQLEMGQYGYSGKRFNRLVKYTRRHHLNPSFWLILMDIDKELNNGLLVRSLSNQASKYFPTDPHFHRDKGVLKSILGILGGRHIARILIKFPTVRRYIIEGYHSQEESIRCALLDAFESGSVESTFPHSPPEMSPENFENYIKESKTLWWVWIKNNTPVKKAKGHRLLDIGAGPGFFGHHFQYLGYEITAVSGNDLELLECANRGMKTIRCDMHSIPVPSHSFDAVLASHVLEHSVIPYVLLLEIRRILKPDGLLFVNLPYPIEGDPATYDPTCYDPETDQYFFDIDPRTGNVVDLNLTYHSYGVKNHVFVLTYWQWRWLFRLTGFRHHASVIELIEDTALVSIEDIQDRNKYAKVRKNQLFILRCS
jgi:SAM-dependent methyltransferase